VVLDVCPPAGSRTRASPGQGHGRCIQRGSLLYGGQG